MKTFAQIIPLFFINIACSGQMQENALTSVDKIEITNHNTDSTISRPLVYTQGVNIFQRFNPPNGYYRIRYDSSSFQNYLRLLPLKTDGSLVKYYNGNTKPNHAYIAVVDLPIGNKNLHQCADAVIRLRADYLYHSNKKDKIHFNFTNGFRVDYSKWAQGYRIGIDGNTTYWKKTEQPSDNSAIYWQYLEQIFTYSGTLSLSKELVPKLPQNLDIGDVFIQGGSPGHAAIVVDVVENSKGEKLFMLAQSYMPAQELQILRNPTDEGISPWYKLDLSQQKLITPEWEFSWSDLKSF